MANIELNNDVWEVTPDVTDDVVLKTSGTYVDKDIKVKSLAVSGAANKVWKTDADGVPGWRDDANTWRGIQNNLTSTSTVDSLSAAQGKILNEKFGNYLPLAGGTMTGDINFAGTPVLHWNDGAYRQKISVTDDSVTNTSVFTFSQSENSGSSYKDLMVIKDTGIIAETGLEMTLTGTGEVAKSASETREGDSSATTYYYPAKWKYNTTISPVKGTILAIEVPCAGHDYGVQITVNNGATYHPLVATNTGRATTQYAQGQIILIAYDSDGTTSEVYDSSGSVARIAQTGVWRVLNYYDSGNPGDYNQRNYQSKFKIGNAVTRYKFLLTGKDKETLYAVNTTSNSTGTTKGSFYTGDFDPLSKIYYYNTTTGISASTTPATVSNLYFKYGSLADMRYSFNNCANSSAGTLYSGIGKALYLVASPNTDGSAKLYYGENGTTYKACLTTTLPTTDDGLLYIYLGQVYDYYRISLDITSPKVYWYKGGAVRPYLGYSMYNGDER